MNVFLCGMMGCGKSTLAGLLSGELNLKLVDTDNIISARYGDIKKIFNDFGEAHFRALEKAVVFNVCAEEKNAVIALGGGSVLDKESAGCIKKSGIVVYVRAKEQTLLQRLKGGEGRPLLNGFGKKRVEELLVFRNPIYMAVSDIIVDTDGDLPCDSAKKIIEKVINYL